MTLARSQVTKFNYPVPMMKFTLNYEGNLASAAKNARTRDKQNIREQFHPQLVELIKVHPALADPGWDYASRLEEEKKTGQSSIIRFEGFELVPLFPIEKEITCALDILFLRRSKADRLVYEGGDLDNRLLTLFDSLKTPKTLSEFGSREISLPKPFYCLLQDDIQISGLSIRTGQLLHSVKNSDADAAVHLVIDVTIEVRRVTFANVCLLGD